MKGVLVRLYVVGSIVFFLAITVFFFVELNQIRSEKEERADAAFSALTEVVQERWLRDGEGPPGEHLSEEFLNQDVPPLAVTVYSFDVGIDYLWAVNDRFLASTTEHDPGTLPPVFSMNQLVHRRLTNSFEVSDGGKRIITAVYPVFDSSAIFPVLRQILIAILAFLSVVLITAIFHALNGLGDTKKSQETASRSTGGPAAGGETVVVQTSPSAGTSSVPVEVDITKAGTTGLMVQEGFLRRVTLELERAAFHEHDLSVAIFRFHHHQKEPALQRDAEAVLSFFTFEDLCFEWKKDSIAVVFPATPLDDALGQIERFQRHYWAKRVEWDEEDADFACGVSARNGRLVEGERVVGECEAALKRAEKTPGKIMGFSPDPQKYRAFLLSQSR